LAAACKFYPAALLALIMREPLRKFVALAGVLLAALLVYTLAFGRNSASALAILPQSLPFHATFGALDLPEGLDFLRIIPSPGGFHARHLFAGLLTRGLILLAIVIAAARSRRYAPAMARLDPARKLFLLAGGLVVVTCFYAAQNVEYRGIFLLMTVPGLWGMQADRLAWVRGLLAAVPVLLWEAALRGLVRHLGGAEPALLFWLLREGLWWWVVIELTAMLICSADGDVTRLRREAKDYVSVKKIAFADGAAKNRLATSPPHRPRRSHPESRQRHTAAPARVLAP
jgi:hypothetical protein